MTRILQPIRLFTAATAMALLPLAAPACNLPGGMAELRAQVVAEVNAERRANGLSALQLDGRLQDAAQSLACDNANRKAVSHVSANGAQLQGRLRGVGYRFTAASENTQRGAGSPGEVVSWWMGSSGHRANILTSGIGDIGVGIAISDAPDSRVHWVINMGASR
jgi:uncharacterized protein YkwD